MYASVVHLDDITPESSWLEIENSINKELATLKKTKLKVRSFQILYLEGRIFLVVRHKKQCKYLLDL